MTTTPATDHREDYRDAHLRLDAQVCFPLYAATNLVTRAYRPLLKPLGLTYPQYLVMLVLWETPSITVKALCARLLLDSGTVSPLLQRLHAQRLITKRVDPADARRVVVGLAARGERLRAEARAVPEALLCRLLEQQGDDALAQVVVLQQVRGLLDRWRRADDLADDLADDKADDKADDTADPDTTEPIVTTTPPQPSTSSTTTKKTPRKRSAP